MSAAAPGAKVDVSFRSVSFAYGRRGDPVLRDVDWEIEEGSYALVAGPSGSGKSTLLRCINGLAPHFSGGRFGGTVDVGGIETRVHGPQILSRAVGFVFQDPEAQSVAAVVEDEIAFGMEQRGVDPMTMRRRVEEALDLLGIADLRRRSLATLSGGERQRVAVAAVLTSQPRVLVLDEPTSQLDPAGAEEVMHAVARLNADLGLTVVIAEHRLERALGDADAMRVLFADGSAADGEPAATMRRLDPAMLPPIAWLGRALGWAPLPLTIKQGRALLRADGRTPTEPVAAPPAPAGAPLLHLRGVTLGFGRRRVLSGIDLAVRPGELIALMGRNGSGKTTLLRSVIGFHRPESGQVWYDGRDSARSEPSVLAAEIGYVPQRPASLLFSDTVRAELAFTMKGRRNAGLDPVQLLGELGLAHVAGRNPRDLSAGEQERAALAAILVANPRLLLLDEPTRGMDSLRKEALAAILRRLRAQGVAILIATHDVELAAAAATRIVLLGDGDVIADGTPRQVLAGSLTYGTQINRLLGGTFLTVADALAGFGIASG